MSKRSAALIFLGRSDYNALTVMSEELGRELRELDIEPVTLDLLDGKSALGVLKDAIDMFGHENIRAAFSFSGMGVDMVGENTADNNAWQKMQIPVVAWLLDHPAYYMLRHAHPASGIMRLYTTQDFHTFQRDYVRAPFRTACCQFGTFNYGREAQKREPKKNEPPLIIFPKSSGDPLTFERTWQTLPSIIQRVLHNAIDHYWDETPRSGNVVSSVLAAADAAKIELRNDLPLFSFFIALIDRYFRHRKSSLMATELLKLPVKIYGKGFEHIDTSDARAELLAPIDYRAMMDLFHDALAVVTVNPNIDDEGHDRIFSAFGCGALPVSDINPWWRKKFPTLLPYSYDFTDHPITAAIDNVLTDPMRAADISWQIGQQMRTERPFSKAVAEAVELADMHRYFSYNFVTPLETYIRYGK